MIRLQLRGILEHRDVALRAVSAACKLVTPDPEGGAWNDFQIQVVSAVGEAFNNVVLHGYADQAGTIELRIQTGRGRIQVELRDWGASFDPGTVPAPQLDDLPESGLGLYIMQSFMDIAYRPGRPNILTMVKRLEDSQIDARKAESAT